MAGDFALRCRFDEASGSDPRQAGRPLYTEVKELFKMPMTNRSRWAVGSLFFLHGLCFSSWGARIPAIQQQLNLSETLLGTVLFAVPMGSILSLPLAAWLSSHLSSRQMLPLALILYVSFLVTLGLASTPGQLAFFLGFFGVASNLVNVAVNTQAVEVEKLYKKSVMASLHGLWSLAGFVGAGLGVGMMAFQIRPFWHFSFIVLIVLAVLFFNFKFLLPDTSVSSSKTSLFPWPDRTLLGLGLIACLSMICEGTMFDWSGVYFKKIIEAPPSFVAAGYTAFMSTMAGTRFYADRFVARFGIQKVLRTCSLLIFLGLMISVLLPYFWPCILGFLLVGAGTSAVVPLVYSEAGKLKGRSTSLAISSVSTVGFLGFLVGPPLIGWVAGATNLRVSFAIIAGLSLGILFLTRKD